MNFSNENVLIIAVLIGIIIMFLSSGCLCKNNTEQFLEKVRYDFLCKLINSN